MTDELRGPGDSEQWGVTVRFWTVTPEWAAAVLENRNGRNRPIKRVKLERLIAALERGEYRFNSNGIALSADGQLLDGQHRLTAVVQTGISIPVLLVTGLDPLAQDVMDIGATRTLADQLNIRGATRSSNLASAVTLAWRWEQSGWEQPGRIFPSTPQALAYLEGNTQLQEAVASATYITDRLPFNLAVSKLGAAMYRASMLDPAGCDQFFGEQFATGLEQQATDPAFALRERLTALSEQGRKTKSRSKAEFHLALIILAWNAYQLGRPVKQLRWRHSGQRAERFPQMIGPDDLG